MSIAIRIDLNKVDLSEEFRKILWKDIDCRNMSKREYCKFMSKHTGVSEKKIIRYVYQTKDHTDYRFNEVLALLRAIYRTDSLDELLRLVGPNLKVLLTSNIKTEKGLELQINDENVDFILSKEIYLKIYTLCRGKGENYESLVHHFGFIGKSAIETMINREILEHDDKGLVSAGKKNPLFSAYPKLQQKVTELLSNEDFFFDQEGIRNYSFKNLSILYVTEDGMRDIVRLQEEMARRTSDILFRESEISDEYKFNIYISQSIGRLRIPTPKEFVPKIRH